MTRRSVCWTKRVTIFDVVFRCATRASLKDVKPAPKKVKTTEETSKPAGSPMDTSDVEDAEAEVDGDGDDGAEASGKKGKRTPNTPFKRIDVSQIEFTDHRLADNSWKEVLFRSNHLA